MFKHPSPGTLLLSLPSATLLGLLALTGCNEDGGPGTASIDYVLGNSKRCAEVQVETIHVVLSRGEGVDRVELAETYAPCVDGPVMVEDIEPNTYDLLVEGLDQEMFAVFDNLGTDPAERKIEVFEGSLVEVPVSLTARPADLSVRWDFGFSSCMGAGIDRFLIRAFEVGGGNLLLEHEVDCETPGDDAGGYRLVPDPDRVLNGSLLGEVGVVALDAAGVMVGEQTTFVFEVPGAGRPVKVTLDCTELGCTGSGAAD